MIKKIKTKQYHLFTITHTFYMCSIYSYMHKTVIYGRILENNIQQKGEQVMFFIFLNQEINFLSF